MFAFSGLQNGESLVIRDTFKPYVDRGQEYTLLFLKVECSEVEVCRHYSVHISLYFCLEDNCWARREFVYL